MANGFFRLMLVTDRTVVSLDRLPDAVAAAVEGGVDAVQVRERGLARAEMLHLAVSLRRAIAGRAPLIVNGTAELARDCGVDGVHLPETAPAITPAQRHGLLVGRSVHAPRAARLATEEGADYIVVGTIFPSRSHPGGTVGGLSLVRAATEAVPVPVLGIGGITAANAGDVIRAGASGVAVISAILAAPDPRLAAAALRRSVDEALRAPVGGRA
jgi:thiamine-phosphate pyrophosphorylase